MKVLQVIRQKVKLIAAQRSLFLIFFQEELRRHRRELRSQVAVIDQKDIRGGEIGMIRILVHSLHPIIAKTLQHCPVGGAQLFVKQAQLLAHLGIRGILREEILGKLCGKIFRKRRNLIGMMGFFLGLFCHDITLSLALSR